MCGGVEAREADKVWKIYFPNPKAAIPVLLEESGQLDWIHWGRRKEEPGNGPKGGWARLSTVQSGGWEKYRPRRGYGMVQRYMEKEGRPGEKNRTSHWFDVPEGFALECLVIGEGEQRRVYVVTTAPPAEYEWIHDRWPLLTVLSDASFS
ncbi:hypothetical protein NPN27_12200 [Stutzerimonas stutzeri]|uniref:hypothetical protein n=1 Tax=Stutzerimonas stutzeri group TaxID=136846 RepID=UPI002111334A|nr:MULTISPECIES: hypothetical protein [Stutzerimonas stutzeri group]MDA0426038.1 hypothetical protein [Stutzerimonas frequens]UUC81750.1 hypothetical protein NPN27_12200 [Stutzerimonas stutzeri]